MAEVTLVNCDTEPIHIPGRVQSHGFLVTIDSEGIITHCSANISEYIQVDAASLPGQHSRMLDPFLTHGETSGFLHQIVAIAGSSGDFLPSNPYTISIGQAPWYVVVCRSGDKYIFDFEPMASNLAEDLHPVIGRALSEMLGDRQLDRLLQNIALQVRNIIAYDRVMIYKFHHDDHGEVVAESRKEELESWLGLHYPASDIPKQARELYKLNMVRLIADVQSTPSDLLSRDPQPLDLTGSNLRAVSPIHIQYLKNMQVASSFSVSILDNDRLWGLIACHNYTPRFINYRQREAAKLIGQVLSSAVSFRQAEMDQQLVMGLKAQLAEITHQLLRDVSIPEALLGAAPTMLSVTRAAGAALFFENELYLTGETPDSGFVRTLIGWLGQHQQENIFVTDHLSAVLPEAEGYKAQASGLLACRLSKEANEYLLWFKPEILTEVRWAGNPENAKTVAADSSGMLTISPRSSFSAWLEVVHNHSAPWLHAEIEAAMALREEVNHAIIRKVTEFRILNGKLRDAYAELDAFSYTLSHDLKNPVSAISGFAQLISNLSEDNQSVRDMAQRINLRSRDLIRMIDEVLKYSRMGQSNLLSKRVRMATLLSQIKIDLLAAYPHTDLDIHIGATPDIEGDETMLFQVFSNLMSNAVKYSSKGPAPRVRVEGQSTSSGVTYTITDNGIGIAAEDHEKIFGLFNRAQTKEAFEGTGVGLAIVKRIVQKHEGKIWLESQPDKGSVFYVQFAR